MQANMDKIFQELWKEGIWTPVIQKKLRVHPAMKLMWHDRTLQNSDISGKRRTQIFYLSNSSNNTF